MSKYLKKEPNSVLVALMNDPKDWAILHERKWYRIPIKNAPTNIKDKTAKYLAFYHTSKFQGLKWTIRTYGRIKNCCDVSRQELFPDEPLNSTKAHKRYYKIELESLQQLPEPIVSRRGHRLTFVPTTERKFFNHTDINFLFNDSPLEERFFELMTQHNIPIERQWHIKTDDAQHYFLDFAIFCKQRPINVECDGDEYHDKAEQVHYDKQRNNELESKGWTVLRYTTDDILKKPKMMLNNLYKTINKLGGYELVEEPKNFKYVTTTPQIRLFDESIVPYVRTFKKEGNS